MKADTRTKAFARIERFRPAFLAAWVFTSTSVFAFGGDIIVQADGSQLSGILARHELSLTQVVRPGVYQVSAPPTVTDQSVLNELSTDIQVQSAEENSTIQSSETGKPAVFKPNLSDLGTALTDTTMVHYFGARVRNAYVNQKAADLVRVSQALSRFGGGNTTVAVIDTGVDPDHPSLKNSLVPGYDFTRNVAGFPSDLTDLDQSTVAILEQSTVAILEQQNAALLNQSTVAILEQSTVAILESLKLPSDFGHGTMVAGVIHLVAPGVRIMPLKAFRADGTSNIADVIRAIYYAVDNHAQVISMSFATETSSPGLAAAIAYARSKNVICIASAGNRGKREVVYPASLPGVIGVGSTNFLDRRSVFSNFGTASARIAAPGEAIVTTFPGNHYAGVWGTSFSSAMVAGAVGVMLQFFPDNDGSDIKEALDHGKEIEQDMGRSRLDVLESLMYLAVHR